MTVNYISPPTDASPVTPAKAKANAEWNREQSRRMIREKFTAAINSTLNAGIMTIPKKDFVLNAGPVPEWLVDEYRHVDWIVESHSDYWLFKYPEGL